MFSLQICTYLLEFACMYTHSKTRLRVRVSNGTKWIIYKSAMAMAGVDASHCIAVGDSLHHDIKGANLAGIQSAFITGGIHATELGVGKFGEAADQSSVHALALKYDAYPSYVLPSFMW
uniref:Uncharacterized protein n=1 Tax=Davidia involucrata TaxID=16924 RepID=A0A5B6ZEK1_DAVIN